MRVSERGGVRRHEFDGWGDFVDFASSPVDYDGANRNSQNRAEGEPFTGGASTAQAYALAANGWPEGTARARRISDPLVSTIASQIERIEPDYVVEGTGALDVGRFLEGEPECWVRFTPNLVEGAGTKHLTIVYNGTVHANVSADSIIVKGSVVAALVELLELGGHRVQIILGHSNRSGKHASEIVVPVKAFDQPLDIDRLTFALAHPACLRVLAFSVWEHMPETWRTRLEVPGSYGQARAIDDRADITIPEHDFKNPETARAWIIAELAKHDIIIREEN